MVSFNEIDKAETDRLKDAAADFLTALAETHFSGSMLKGTYCAAISETVRIAMATMMKHPPIAAKKGIDIRNHLVNAIMDTLKEFNNAFFADPRVQEILDEENKSE